MIVIYFEIDNFARCYRLKKENNLLLHLFIIHDEYVLASTFNGSSSNQVKANSLSYTYCMCRRDILFLHH